MARASNFARRASLEIRPTLAFTIFPSAPKNSNVGTPSTLYFAASDCAEDYSLLRAGGRRHVAGLAAQGFVREEGKRERFLGRTGNPEFLVSA